MNTTDGTDGARRPRDGDRAERLARRLRENLHRRKAQSRARREAADADPGGTRHENAPPSARPSVDDD